MALINCPECGKEISDQAAICIQCGHPIAAKNAAISPSAPKPVDKRKSHIGTLQQSSAGGAVFIVLGFASLFATLFAFIVFPLFGILAALGTLILFVVGRNMKNGTYDLTCPCCGAVERGVPSSFMQFTCKQCKRTSRRNGDYIEET
jgi:predicted amidophosphoribosyltransferase